MSTAEAPSEILTPGTHLWEISRPEEIPTHQSVAVLAQGRYRRARVVKVGPKRTTVAYGTSGTPYREKTLPHALIYAVAPLDESDRERYCVVRARSTGGQYLES